jgi:DnaJ family protein C protein 17
MNDLASRNYYALLDVPPDAKNLEIIRAYRRAKLTYRADSIATYSLFGEAELAHIRAEIELAYQTLSDPERRQAYDDALLAACPDRQADEESA